MKILYLCGVIVVSCGLCASGDLEIYPGIQFDAFTDEDSRNRLRRGYHPFQADSPEDPGEPRNMRPLVFGPLPEAGKRRYREDVDWGQLKMRDRHKSRQRHHDVVRSGYGFPVLTEPRVGFEDFEGGGGGEGDSGRFPGKMLRDDLKDLLELHSMGGLRLRSDEDDQSERDGDHDMHGMDRNLEDESDSFPSGRFENVETADDPTDFAYVPPDPRFYRSFGATEKDRAPERATEPQPPSETTLRVNHRSDVKAEREPEIPERDVAAPPSGRDRHGVELIAVQPSEPNVDTAEVYVIAVVAGISAAATVGLIAVGIGWYNLRKHVKNAQDVDYPAYGITGPNKDLSPSGDRRLAQSAQMYHYQHQKQQIIAMERAPPGERNGSVSDGESEEENEEGDYTVYECPGLAPTGEMEVKNPLFQDDPTPAQTPATKAGTDEKN